MNGSAGIRFDDLTVVRGGRAIVSGVSMSVPHGTVGAILGPSGAGKSTILRAIAGLDRPDRGMIELCGEPVFSAAGSLAPERRQVGMVFQGFALWPHLTARRHLTFTLSARGVPRGDWDGRIREVAAVLGMGPFLDRRPASLSGGERQRLALARALVARPAALLLDEPTASVDAAAARALHAYVQELLARFGVTTLLVTHDQEEALSLAGTVLLLDRGEALQCGAPEDLYRRPASLRAARLIGEGAILPATAAGSVAETPLGAVALAASASAGRGCVLARPESVIVDAAGGSEGVEAVVLRHAFQGASFRVVMRVESVEVLANAREAPAPGSRVRVRLAGPVPFFEEGGG